MLKIGELAKRGGCLVETVRYYEHEGLMPAPHRTQSGHRLYEPDQVRRLVFIRRCRGLNFTLEEIRSLLSFLDRSDATCGEVHDFTLNHLETIRHKIAEFKDMETALQTLADNCAGGQSPDCAVLDALYDAGYMGRGPV